MTLGDQEAVAMGLMARAWREAAVELGIRFESPFAMRPGGEEIWCAGWLPEFGGPRGAIIVGRESVDEVFDVAEALGYFCSGLNPAYYETFTRARFVETLDDWGWFGNPARAPAWFAGGFGRHGGRE